MIDDAVARADRLLSEGQLEAAIVLINEASAAGDAGALFQQAVWKLTGHPIPRDVPGARSLLKQATKLGHINAALFEVALTANGSGAPADWSKAKQLLEAVAKISNVAAEQLALIQKMPLTAEGAPTRTPPIRRLGSSPDVWRIEKLFTPLECRHVGECAVDMLAPATVANPQTGANMLNPVRTSDGAVLGPTRETLVIQALNRRLAAVTNTHWRQGEALSVLRYQQGQQFRPHVDALPATRNQRVRTVLVYLNDGFEGGHTWFAGNQLRVAPKTGDAIIFDNVRADGSADPSTLHSGEPVVSGVKWLATRWIRSRPFDVWTGPEIA